MRKRFTLVLSFFLKNLLLAFFVGCFVFMAIVAYRIVSRQGDLMVGFAPAILSLVSAVGVWLTGKQLGEELGG